MKSIYGTEIQTKTTTTTKQLSKMAAQPVTKVQDCVSTFLSTLDTFD